VVKLSFHWKNLSLSSARWIVAGRRVPASIFFRYESARGAVVRPLASGCVAGELVQERIRVREHAQFSCRLYSA
jgi:hypothetical protein